MLCTASTRKRHGKRLIVCAPNTTPSDSGAASCRSSSRIIVMSILANGCASVAALKKPVPNTTLANGAVSGNGCGFVNAAVTKTPTVRAWFNTMNYCQQNEELYNELCTNARRFMRIPAPNPFGAAPEQAEVVLHLTYDHPFGDDMTWVVFWPDERRARKEGEKPSVLRVIWRRKHDERRCDTVPPEQFTSEPTYVLHETSLDRERFDKIIEAGNRISLPLLFQPNQPGLRDASFWHLHILNDD
jgi:hypothetical protein